MEPNTSKRNGSGDIKRAADAEPRPLTAGEAQELFEAMAVQGDTIAFQYVRAGCESRAQLMIEHMEQLGINPGRAWALSVGRDLVITDPLNPQGKITWNNHVAPTVAVAWRVFPTESLSSTPRSPGRGR